MKTKPITEKRDVQEKIKSYLSAIGWKYVHPSKAIDLRGGIKRPFLAPIVKKKLIDLNGGVITEENVDDVIRKLQLLPANFRGNEEFLSFLRGQKTIYVEEEKRERNIMLIDYDDIEKNSFIFTEEFWFEDRKKRRADVVLFINGFPVGVIENKAPTLEEAEEEAFGQIKEYTNIIPELIKYTEFYSTCDGIHLHYGPTWRYTSKTLYEWKTEKKKGFENLVKTFFDKKEILRTLEDYTVFLKLEGEAKKYILKSHQRRAVRKILRRVLKGEKDKGLVWHTQGACKTVTMIVTAKKLREAPELENPTILAVVDRLSLESQIQDNLEAMGFPNVVRAENKKHLRELLASDHRGLIVTLIQKFEGMPKNINKRKNIYVLIDEAHRSQEGHLANYMHGGLPNAFYFGFTGTPIDKGKVGRGTFNTFGIYDKPKGYLDKYPMEESIKEGTTIPISYNSVMTDLHVDKEMLEKDFFKIIEEKGIVSLEEANKIIEKAHKLKAILKSSSRVEKIAEHIADHFKKHVEPLGFKAFIVGVDREACALYKEAIDKYLPSDYSKVIYTKSHKDSELLKKYHISNEEEKSLRKSFKHPDEKPKIFIVTEKLLTGFDAPVLYAMYLDKPFKDHTLLQAIARVDRPYEGKPFGLVMDYVGIFENLKKALTFDSKDISKGLINIQDLKDKFKELMGQVRRILKEIDIEDEKHRIGNIIDYFFDEEKIDEEKRKEFVKLVSETQELYGILSPSKFVRDYIEDYKLLVKIYRIIYKEFSPEAKMRRARRGVLKKTENLIQENVELKNIEDLLPSYKIDENTVDLIRSDTSSNKVKVLNLRRNLLVHINREKSRRPYLLSISKKVENIIKKLRKGQIDVKSTLKRLTNLTSEIVKSQEEEKKSDLNKDEFSLFWILKSYKIEKAEELAKKIYEKMEKRKNWPYSKKIEREIRKELYKSLMNVTSTNKIVNLVNSLLESYKIRS